MKLKLSLAALLMGANSLLAQNTADMVILDENGIHNLRIQTVEADEREFETTVFAIGRIEDIPSNRSVLSSRIAGRVVELKAFEGDYVNKGQTLARVESRQLGDPPPSIELKAPQQGKIIDSHVRLGQPVEPDTELLDIADRSQMWAIAKIPEQEAALVTIGSSAHIRIPALGDQLIEAKLQRFGVDADREAGTVEGIFTLDNPHGKLSPGMRAEFSIVLSTRQNVLMVPKVSLQGSPAERVVFVKDFDLPNAFIRTPVRLGEQNDQFVEILSGLFPGDEIVTRGSYSLSFAGGGSGVSLKEALDAAHGHAHNEDGSEITDDQKSDDDHGHDHGEGDESHSGSSSLPWMIYSGLSTLVCVVFAQLLWRKRSNNNS
ncbi:efflux RND transporter periplasmic adaptor subunit [Pelagicoccus sp. SDUM812005]|uniref:efflux RND transporter periplasmic adaptor subunit n=1 Tax=Pelagicoccus sp. SDUM812005 TaxID=3041257 RepID=UPI00280C5AF4|nr:efflux RND transporter periplasmic adaptor subunit [Pelagicoccus sp. SDUM812005]MDQ8180385.1 efflux RND transporter periplasmic adaptor subunit [Pelagicoccus sp. SDUM812005]